MTVPSLTTQSMLKLMDMLTVERRDELIDASFKRKLANAYLFTVKKQIWNEKEDHSYLVYADSKTEAVKYMLENHLDGVKVYPDLLRKAYPQLYPEAPTGLDNYQICSLTYRCNKYATPELKQGIINDILQYPKIYEIAVTHLGSCVVCDAGNTDSINDSVNNNITTEIPE